MTLLTEKINKKFNTVMVIDDSVVQRQHTVSICNQLGLAICAEAINGQDALEKIRQLDPLPDLLLIDLEMPVMDGIALIQQLAEHKLSVSILILSSREAALISSVETMVKAYGLPIVGALHKPLSLEKIEKVLYKYAQKLPIQPTYKPAKVSIDQNDLMRAIELKQFVTYFQPKILISNSLIKGVEALIRWQHPEKGLIFPNDFIPLAESTGLIHEITIQVLDLALGWLKQWQSHGLKLCVAINLSAVSLADLALVDKIHQRVCANQIEPSSIILEITETAVMANVALSLNTLARLRLIGFGLSIDDYGTGFSSMQQLARIPFTELKIDRSFVDGSSESFQLENMVSISLDTGRKLGLTCVAEGVEVIEDWQLLKRLGCHVAQGYLIAKPMPGNELIDWIKSNNKRLREL